MIKAENIPRLAEVDCLCLDGTRAGIVTALQWRRAGKKVLIATSQSFIPTDLTERYLQKPGQIYSYPDGQKKRMEALCEQAGIDLLYGITEIEEIKMHHKSLLVLAAKGGVYGIRCGELKREQISAEYKNRGAVFVRKKAAVFVLSVPLEEKKQMPDRTIAKQLLNVQERLLAAFSDRRRQEPELQLGRFLDSEYYFTGKRRREAEPPECSRCDVLVIGGGTAGAMAALHAARGGVKTILVESQYALGGTGTIGGVNSYWFGNRYQDVSEIDQAVDQVYQKLDLQRESGIWSKHDHFHGGIKAYVLLKLCLEAGVEVIFGQMAYAVEGGGVLVVKTAGPAGKKDYQGKQLIDATGDGDIAVLAGADYVYGSAADAITYWASLAQYPGIDTYQNNFSSLVRCEDPWDMTRFIRLSRQRGDCMFDHGIYVSMRESRHICGKTQINLKDMINFRQYEDALYTCYSNYDPKGKLSADMIYCGWLVPQMQIQVPLSALLPIDKKGNQIKGLYIAGKAISATHNAFPSLRMQPDLMHQGAVLGLLAATAVRRDCSIETLDQVSCRRLIEEYTGDELTLPVGDDWDCKTYVEKLTGKERRHWVDVSFFYMEKEVNAKLAIVTAASEEVCTALLQRIAKEQADFDLVCELKQLALWHGGGVDMEDIIAKMNDELSTGLPMRKASVMCAQLLPDHGVMPELVYQMNLLAHGGQTFPTGTFPIQIFEKVMQYLIQQDRDYHDIKKGIYHYIESFAYVAERSGEMAFLPLLTKLQQFKEFEQAFKPERATDILTERLLILWLRLNSARARLGDQNGYQALFRLLSIGSRAISKAAEMCLQTLLGQTVSLTRKEWERWLYKQEQLPIKLIHKKEW
jgi:hypothetical protein